MLSPVILFVYNRPWHLRQTLESLQRNLLSDQSVLFIYSDGPADISTHEQLEKIGEVRKIITEKLWCKEVHIIESKKNKGLANSIITGVKDIINRYGKAIVLEDDMLTSKYFLQFMNDALNLYENNKDIICISGYVYPIKKKLPETFFIKGADCWGWATWKRGWDIFEINGEKLLEQLNGKMQTSEFDYNHSYPFTKMLKDQIEEKNDSWAIRWYASAFINEKLTLYPGRSLVQNIGTDESGTHFRNTEEYRVKLSDRPVIIESIFVKENLMARNYFENYFKTLGGESYFSKKILRKMNYFIKKHF